MTRAAALLCTCLLAACGSERGVPVAATVEPFTQAQIEQTWVWRIAFDESMDEGLVLALARRWLTLEPEPDPAWAPIGEPTGVTAATPRARGEDAAAVTHLGELYRKAVCDLHRGQGLPEGVAEAALLGVMACEQKGFDAVAWAPPEEASVAQLLAPVVDTTLELHGERLRYRFQHPWQFDAAYKALHDHAEGEPDDPVWQVGRSNFGGGIQVNFDDPSQAGLERAAEEHIARWRASLEATDLGAVERALLLQWVRGAVYRAAASQAEEGAQLVLLEEAAGADARVRPGPGRDPLLLARIAVARYESGSPGRAAELLGDMAGQPGWEWLLPTAEACARVAVLPSAAVEGVRR